MDENDNKLPIKRTSGEFKKDEEYEYGHSPTLPNFLTPNLIHDYLVTKDQRIDELSSKIKARDLYFEKPFRRADFELIFKNIETSLELQKKVDTQ